MGKRKKKQIHCVQTGLPCEWYKKGKNHRVLVRADGVVIANNPAPLGRALKKYVGGAVKAGGSLLGLGDGEPTKGNAAPEAGCRPSNRYTTEERVADALR